MTISVQQIAGNADTAKQGGFLYVAISKAFSDEPMFAIDFSGIQTATSSFVNIAFVPLLDTNSLADIKNKMQIVRSTRQINEMIKSRLEREAHARASAA